MAHEHLTTGPPGATTVDTPSTSGPPWACDAGDVLRQHRSDRVRGLVAADVAQREERYGPNELDVVPPPSLLRRFVGQFVDPLVGLLLVAMVISGAAWWFDDESPSFPVEVVVIAAIIVANAIIGVWQEGRAITAVEALKSLAAPHTRVLRDGAVVDVLTRSLVPGDIVVLAEGDAIGCHARLIEVASLQVAEAALTGESMAVDKRVDPVPAETSLAERSSMVFSGTAVTRGRARAVACATGQDTEIGRIASMLDEAGVDRTPLQRQIDRLGRVLGLLVIALSVIVLVAIFATSEIEDGADALDALLVAVSLAVAAVPEGLPAILTVVLALGVQRMADHHAIVKRLLSVETLGSATVICTDKTGTLTRNEMTVVRLATASGSADLDGVGYEPVGELSTNGRPPMTDPERVVDEVAVLLDAAGAANDARLERTDDGWTVSGDPTEIALRVAEEKVRFAPRRAGDLPRVAELPFDSDRKLMSTLHDGHLDTHVAAGAWEHATPLVQYTKGAPDILLGRCDREYRGGEIVPLTERRIADIEQTVATFADQGLRTLGAAMREHTSDPDAFDYDHEDHLVFLGVLGLADPARPEVVEVIAEADRAGVRTVMLTGDHPRTARAIGAPLGLRITDESVASGAELGDAEFDDPAFTDRVARTTVFARVAPEHKLGIVRSLQATGNVVSMTGDGVNDAPALRQADIGVAMGGIGTEVSREAADMILADDDFTTIVHAIREGREIFADIRKFLRYLLGSNSGEVLVMIIGVLAAGALGLADAGEGIAVPLLATQILWINLLTDSALALALGVDPSVDDVMAVPPRALDDPIIDRPMWTTIALVGTTSALAGLVALDLELAGGMLGGDGDLETARTMLFTTVVLAQIFNAFNARSDVTSAFVRTFENRLLVVAAAATVVMQVGVVHLGPLQEAFDTTSLDIGQWVVCSALASSVLVVNEFRKWVVRRFRPGVEWPLGPGDRTGPLAE